MRCRDGGRTARRCAAAGYAFDRFFIYGAGGATFGNVRANFSNDPVTSSLEAGWTVGAGVEIAFGRNWSANAEYLSSTLPMGHAPQIVPSPMQAERPSFLASPSSSTRASSAEASIIGSACNQTAPRKIGEKYAKYNVIAVESVQP